MLSHSLYLFNQFWSLKRPREGLRCCVIYHWVIPEASGHIFTQFLQQTVCVCLCVCVLMRKTPADVFQDANSYSAFLWRPCLWNLHTVLLLCVCVCVCMYVYVCACARACVREWQIPSLGLCMGLLLQHSFTQLLQSHTFQKGGGESTKRQKREWKVGWQKGCKEKVVMRAG